MSEIRIINADVMEGLGQLGDESVHCVVTSPPYWGLRDYGVDGQIGLEPTVKEYVERLVAVFAEVRRVLRADGTLWLNMGDCYCASPPGNARPDHSGPRLTGSRGEQASTRARAVRCARQFGEDLKPKDLIGLPWRIAFALQAEGWWLRSDIIWSKPNPMPESVTDRPTKAHEYVFLMANAERYYYDADAAKESCAASQIGRVRSDAVGGANHKARGQHSAGGVYSKGPSGWDSGPGGHRKKAGRYRSGNKERVFEGRLDHKAAGIPWQDNGEGRNARSVWRITTQPYPEAHFATFPEELAERCIKAGCPQGGTVLDPFGGAGTTGLVAAKLARDAILIELNAEYVGIAERRIANEVPLLVDMKVLGK